MALVSPGIQVTVTDESNYSPAQPGSVPYILLATSENKAAPGGGIASGTLKENAGKVYAITSQRDLITTFGTPKFHATASGSQINGGEQNEYGLLTAYSALGVSNQVFVQRADIDLAQLTGTTIRPVGNPENGMHWLDTANTNWGLYVWNDNKQIFETVAVTVVPEVNVEVEDGVSSPSNLYGAIGDYAVVTTDSENTIFYKRPQDNTWVVVGSTEWEASIPAVTGNTANPTISEGGTLRINSTNVSLALGTTITSVVSTINAANVTGVKALNINNRLVLTATRDSLSSGASGRMTVSGTESVLGDLGIAGGAYNGATTTFAPYYAQPAWNSFETTKRPSGSIWVKTSVVGNGLSVVVKKFSSAAESWSVIPVGNYFSVADATYSTDPVNGGLNISTGTIWAKYNVNANNSVRTSLWYRKDSGPTYVIGSTATPVPGTPGDSFSLQVTQPKVTGYGPVYNVVIGGEGTAVDFITAIQSLNIPNIKAEIDVDGRVKLTHVKGGDILFSNDNDGLLDKMGINTGATNTYDVPRSNNSLVSTNWEPLENIGYAASANQPHTVPTDGTLWYWNSPIIADIMINTGNQWVGYRNATTDIRGFDLSATDVYGIQAQTTAPSAQRNGSALAYGDLWLDTSDLENFPRIYRWQVINGINQWVLIDNTDDVSQDGILFADARWSLTGAEDPVLDSLPNIRLLAVSDYLDLDAPDASLYPRGMLLFNTRASGYNVKKYVSNYFTAESYPNQELPARSDAWVSVSGYKAGSSVPAFGRHAQRNLVVNAMKSAIGASIAIREEQNQFNIIACPGYSELVHDMVSLNNDRNNTAFIIGDTPMRLAATGTEIIAWAQNASSETQTNESGLTLSDPYVGMFYPQGLATNLDGNSVVVPASYAMVRAFIRNDNASYPWFAPAGTRRGTLDNVTSVGYVDAVSGNFVTVGLTTGLRDVMYNNKINPLTYMPGTGLVCYGQKTLGASPTALDRINVARLINYIRSQLDVLARPFVFEPNDPITRKSIKAVTESLLNDLVSKRGVADYLVVCDDTNNTSDRIARNELYVDVAIQPTKDVEFIYIPIRLTAPGQLESGNTTTALTAGTGA